jgi:type IV secretion system protein VirB11
MGSKNRGKRFKVSQSITEEINVITPRKNMREQSVERLYEGLRRDFGEVCLQALMDPAVIEIMLNPDGRIWIDKAGQGMFDSGAKMPASQAMKLFTTIATRLGSIINAKNPILEGELELGGGRFEALIAPIVKHPTFSIRKKASFVFTLEDYQKSGILTAITDPTNTCRQKEIDFVELTKNKSHYDIIKLAIESRKNILVVGSTGSGKTTLVNAILDGIARFTSDHRIVLIEDTNEIQCTAKNYVQLRSCEAADMTRLLRATMRLRPDRILVGEVRGGEALALLKAWNTGHPGGVATVHANSCEAGLIRLEQLVQEAIDLVNPQLIAEAVDLVIFIEKASSISIGRKVRELGIVKGYDTITKQYQIQYV